MTAQGYSFKMPSKYIQIYYDIETYNTANQHLVPESSNKSSHIAMIQVYIVNADNSIEKIVMLNG